MERRLVAFALLSSVSTSCVWTEADKRAFEDDVRPVLITGYEDFRFYRGDGHYGTWVWSYQLPPGLHPSDALRAAKEQIQRVEPCFDRVLRDDAKGLNIRCGSKEYRILLDVPRRRVFMLEMRTVPGNTER